MADQKISELAAAAALDGSELVEAVQGGVNVKTTTQDIADLAAPSGGGHVIENEGTPLTQRANLNFVGDGVSAADAGGKTVVTIPDGGAGKQASVNSAVALTDGASIDLTATKHTLATDEATITFTISYTGDDIVMEVTLTGTIATYTFPSGSLCVTEGVATGNNSLTISGLTGDKYIITTKKIGSVYYVVAKNFGQ